MESNTTLNVQDFFFSLNCISFYLFKQMHLTFRPLLKEFRQLMKFTTAGWICLLPGEPEFLNFC